MQASACDTVSIAIPTWADELAADFAAPLATHEAQMGLAIALSRRNVEEGGGPFGAAVFAGPQLIAVGVNCVLSSGLSIAHAEIVALLRAQKALAAASTRPSGPLTLISSAEPCCQCFGALIWSGVDELVCGANTRDVEAIGFDEGPKPQPWADVLRARGIRVLEGLCREQACEALRLYAERGGPIYGLRGSMKSRWP
jgi:tRNA(Arg) A34 adenosine deaminase TadA